MPGEFAPGTPYRTKYSHPHVVRLREQRVRARRVQHGGLHREAERLRRSGEGDAVDVLPSYPGGMDALRKFLEKNLHTPDELENGETVNVRVKFVVDYTGKLQSFVTVLDGGDAYNKEVVRVLKKMPNWIPGKANGENVPVYFTIPVKFVMTD